MTADLYEVTEPGVYDMPAAAYHADPVPGHSLSSSGARKLMPPNCPARFRWEQLHGQPPKAVFDFGHAAHQAVLGVGPEIAALDYPDWRTKKAQADRDAAREAGMVPLLLEDVEVVAAMADAIRAHPYASKLLRPGRGRAEQALFWRDVQSGIWRRALLDWLPDTPLPSGRTVIVDYKTCDSAEPSACSRSMFTYGYHQQADWYIDGVLELRLAENPTFALIFQEKTAPYLVTVTEPDRDALFWADTLNRKAIDIYRTCMESGQWPGYAQDIVLASLPAYALRSYEIAQARGAYDIKETVR